MRENMSKRAKFGALAGALLFTFAVASSALAAAPTYSISVAKTASPTTVAAAGTVVTFTVWVTNNGTGFFGAVSATDDHCTLDGPFGDQDKGNGAGKLEAGETWSFTCSYAVGSARRTPRRSTPAMTAASTRATTPTTTRPAPRPRA
jgi:hypothetical protein